MRGRVFKRCGCAPRCDRNGRRLACARPHGSWSFVADVPVPRGQRRRQVGRGGFRTRRDAEAALVEFVHDGEPARPTDRRLGEYLTEWLALVRPTLAVTAWSSYRRLIRLYVLPYLADQPLSGLTGLRLTSLYGQLMQSGGVGGRPLSTTTVRLVHRVLSKALNDAIESDLLVANPAVRAKPPKRHRPELQVWTAAEASRFLEATRDDRLYAVWLLALTCGLRRGELAGLHWRNLDLGAGTVAIVTQRTTDSDWNVVTTEPKGTSRRTIDLGAAAIGALRAHRAAQHRERLAAGSGWTDTDLVFARQDGVGYHPQRLTDLFQAAARQAGVPVIRLHDARHSCATLALAAGLHPRVVQQLLGHASWSTTMDLYTHRVERLQREAATRIEAIVLQPAAPSNG